jgi:hypothetical protein
MAPKTDRDRLIAFARRVRKLHELVLRGGTDHERETARRKLEDLLAERRMSLADVAELLALAVDNPQQGLQADDDGDNDGATPPPSPSFSAGAAGGKQPDAFELIDWALRRFLYLEEHQYTALALWGLHTFLFREFQHSPRLALLSPVRGCGKSVVLDLLEKLCLRANKFGSTTTAVLPRLIDADQSCVLLDEADNLDFARDPVLRAVLNDGFKAGAKRALTIKGEVKRFNLFSPVALAAIGRLPLPLMSRALVLNLSRAPKSAKIERLDFQNPVLVDELDFIYRTVFVWSQGVRGKLHTDPQMPSGFYGRTADRWRAVFSIADALGRGDEAREAARAFAGEHQDEDIKVTLLGDIRTAFGADTRLGVVEMLERLLVLESEASWQEFCGEHGDQSPKPLTRPALTKMVRTFGIRTRTLWPKQRTAFTKSCRGYRRSDFEAAWVSFCPDLDTAPQQSQIRRLVGV